MPPEEKYTDQQREAVRSAYLDRGVGTMARIVELAAAGELVSATGDRVEPFEIPAATVRSLISKERKKRTGRIRSDLLDAAPRDAIERLRQRLVAAADKLLQDFEKQALRAPGKADPERLRQLVRVVREASALPGPTDPRPPAPGQQVAGKREPETRGGIAGAILNDVAGDDRAPLEAPPRAAEPEPESEPEPMAPADAVRALLATTGARTVAGSGSSGLDG